MPCDVKACVPNSVTLSGRKAGGSSPGRGARTSRRTPRASARSESGIGSISNKLSRGDLVPVKILDTWEKGTVWVYTPFGFVPDFRLR